MLDLSPEKLIVLLAIGMMVLGPQRLPSAARSLAVGLAKARKLAGDVTDPVHAALAEPRRAFESAMSEVRDGVVQPVREIGRPPQDPHLN